MDSAVHAFLRTKRKKTDHERKQGTARSNSTFSLSHDSALPGIPARHKFQSFHSRRVGFDSPCVDKEFFIERLVLDEVISSIATRCALFMLSFVCSITLMWLSYPASALYPVHQTIIAGFDLKGSFKSISSVEDAQAYLTAAAAWSRTFSPTSSTYLDDVQSKSFLDVPHKFPPAKQLGNAQFPSLTKNFTLTVWVKTRDRLDVIIRKQTENLITCWSIGPEAVMFGEHDSYQLERVAHPWAQSIYQPNVSQVAQVHAWKTSEIRSKVSDNQWHHLGFRVTMSNIDFVYDGKVVGNSPLQRPMSDCPGAHVIIGSERFVAEMTDLVYFNRFLNDEDLEDTFRIGRPIDVLLSGSGPMSSPEGLTVQQKLTDMDAASAHSSIEMADKVQFGQRSVSLEMVKRRARKTATTTILGPTHTTTPTTVSKKSENAKGEDSAQPVAVIEKSCWNRTKKDAFACLRRNMTLVNIGKQVRMYAIRRYSREVVDALGKKEFSSLISKIHRKSVDTDLANAPWNAADIMIRDSLYVYCLLVDCQSQGDHSTESRIHDFYAIVLETVTPTCVLLAEQKNCRLDKVYQKECPATCGLPSPTPIISGSTSKSRHQLVDSSAYRDLWDRDCAWYQVNDKKCKGFASDETRRQCQNTCGPYDDHFLTVEEMNALLLMANQDHLLIPRNLAHNYVAYFCCLQKNDPADAAQKKSSSDSCRVYWPTSSEDYLYIFHDKFHTRMDAQNDTYSHDDIKILGKKYPECFLRKTTGGDKNLLANIGFPTKWLFESDADNIILQVLKDAILDPPLREKSRNAIMTLRVPHQTRTVNNDVQLFVRGRVLDDAFSLTVENVESRWKACSTHSTCTTLAFACQPDHYDREACKDFRDFGLPPQKQFCSPTCFTGGCDAANKVCQPCDVCKGNECTGACGTIEHTTDSEFTGTLYFDYRTALKNYEDKVDKWHTSTVDTNTFTISAWVKDFSYQRLLEKRVNVTLPRSFVDSEGYNATTGTLSCYWLSNSEFCFRNHWYDKKMTCIPNSLASVLQDDMWHHLVVVKSAIEKTPQNLPNHVNGLSMKKRLDDFIFFVDGKPSITTQFKSNSGRFSSIPRYAASDCGGPMVTTVEISHARDDALLAGDTEKLADDVKSRTGTDLSHFLLFGNSTVILRFVNLGIPKNAVIKQAYLEFSAVQNPVHRSIKNAKCSRNTQIRLDSPERMSISFFPDHFLHEPCTDVKAKGCFAEIRDACSLRNNSSRWKKTKGEVRAPVRWDVRVTEWRKTNLQAAVVKSGTHDVYEPEPYEAETHSDAVRISPDLSSFIKDMVTLESYNQTNSTATFTITRDRKDTCLQILDEGGLSYNGRETDCEKFRKLRDYIDDTFPFLALSKEGASKAKSGFAPRLRIYWCHTEDCISPTFAAAGDDGKWGQKGFAVSNHSDLQAYPQVKNFTNHSNITVNTPTYHDIPYMVLGASITENQDPLRYGKIFDLRTMPKAMTLSEVQQMYYSNVRTVPNLAGPEHLIDAESDESQLAVLHYAKEVVSIAPPILLQNRSQAVPCANLVPALGTTIKNYFDLHITKKCSNGPYTCQFPNGSGGAQSGKEDAFSCVDRAHYVDSDTHFGRGRVKFAERAHFFPEFLELMNLRTVYRDQKMLAAKTWLDLASSTIILVGVFFVPSDRVSTLMELTIKNDGAGKVDSSYSLSSLRQMSYTEQMLCIILACIASTCCFMEVYFIISSWICRLRDRKKWMCLAFACHEMRAKDIRMSFENRNTQEVMEREESWRMERMMKMIVRNCLIIDFWDVFDIVLRLFVIALVVAYTLTNFAPPLHLRESSQNIDKLEQFMKNVLQIDWHKGNTHAETKIQAFVDQIGSIVGEVNRLQQLRIYCSVLILICIFRVIVYMRVHPRVAILYKTVAAILDDLFHFALTFSFLYLSLAFAATWTFGAVDKRYATFGASCYSQFNMIIGEYPMDPMVELQSLYAIYLSVFCVVMFFITVNFFLAILVDSYRAIKDQVNECRLAQNFLVDVYFSLTFPYHQWVHQWPSRWQLIDMLLRADVDGDGLNDEEQPFSVSVRPQDLVEQEIIPQLDSATALLTHYLNFSPALAAAKKQNKKHLPFLEHHIVLKRLLQLDLVSHDLRGWYHEVHPLGRKSEETKMLVKQLIRSGQKALIALRMNKAQLGPDTLMQDDGMTDSTIIE